MVLIAPYPVPDLLTDASVLNIVLVLVHHVTMSMDATKQQNVVMNTMDNRTVLNIFSQQLLELHVKYTIAQIRRVIFYLDAVTMHPKKKKRKKTTKNNISYPSTLRFQ
ncbi:uncharacterized protein LOC144617700 isoform X2 [Crassostrea virginica]